MRESFRRRREDLFDRMAQERGEDAVAVVPAAQPQLRNNDTEHPFRQDSDFYYLTGFDEPDAVLVMATRERKTTLFVRPRDPERETWDGPRAGVEGAKSDYGADEAFALAELDTHLIKLFQNQRRLYYRLGRNRTLDSRIFAAIERGMMRGRSPFYYPSEIVDLASLLHEQRLVKTEDDLASMRKALAITGEAHVKAMATARPGMNEAEIEGVLLETFRRRGAKRVAYQSIVGSGHNAAILHYVANDRTMQEGELLLIDAGCEYEYFASDVTRTFPVSGTFSREQRAIYDVVLEAQLEAISACRVGANVDDVHKQSVAGITRGLVKLGLLTGEPEKLIEEEKHKPFYMHRTSHWLGMDVHDVGQYYVDGKPRPLAPGMVLTVEPGIYLSKDFANVAPEWRSIGVRIEDDILITENGPVVLSEAIPKLPEDVERVCRG
ncbi:aminopeptidase P N-terminal domain-containing protein [Pendulispora rubella]|uniref:Xaa-Pro aminopeptidase n=1 Tax=Pendulispora rubella TaxID=2741070 RepID=A0ABZ2LFF8_9BACT